MAWDWVDGSWTNLGGGVDSSLESFDYSNYWTPDDQTTGSVGTGDILSFLTDYPEYTSFFSSDLISGALGGLGSAAKSLITNPKTGKIDPARIAAIGGGIAGGLGLFDSSQQKTGYQGGIPELTAVREQVPGTYDPNRRPGSRGQEYMTQTQFVSPSDVATAKASAAEEAKAAEARNKSRAAEPQRAEYAAGGLATMAKGRYLNGATDGMEDKLDATIDNKQPAKLSHGEFVVPADIVSHLGNGNSEAGATRLYEMMDRIRKARTGTTKQGKQINPNKFLPG